MRRLFEIIRRVARILTPALIEGEDGTGKELVARAIHVQSTQRKGPFLAVNCSASRGQLLEREFFGHVRGAFSGAVADAPGYVEAARGGTLLLDEAEGMSLEFQATILRLIGEGEYHRVGEAVTRRADVYFLAATKRDLHRLVLEGAFRKDLYYRLRGVPIRVPALRERMEDLPLLFENILGEETSQNGIPRPAVGSEVLESIRQHSWPGNVRELRNAIRFLLVTLNDGAIDASSLRDHLRSSPALPGVTPLAHLGARPSREEILRQLGLHHGNKAATAKAFGVHRTTLYNWLRRFGIDPSVSAWPLA